MSKNLWEYFTSLGKNKEPEEQDSGSNSSSSSGSDSGRRKPRDGEGFTTYLVEENEQMGYERRGLEQQIERQLATVQERKRPQREVGNAPGGVEQNIKQHPLLNSQRFDGIDPGLNPAPFGNQEAQIAFENERREQDQEKQLRLGNMPKMGNSYIPELKR